MYTFEPRLLALRHRRHGAFDYVPVRQLGSLNEMMKPEWIAVRFNCGRVELRESVPEVRSTVSPGLSVHYSAWQLVVIVFVLSAENDESGVDLVA